MAKLRITLADGAYRELERRAALRGVSAADYVAKLVERDQRRPTTEEWLGELRDSPGVDFEVAKVEAARELVDADPDGGGARPRR